MSDGFMIFANILGLIFLFPLAYALPKIFIDYWKDYKKGKEDSYVVCITYCITGAVILGYGRLIFNLIELLG